MVTLVDRAKMNTATTGTGTITLGTAEDGFQTFAAAGVPDGYTVRYVIEEDGAWEIGTGTYTASGTTLSRDFISASSNSGNAINLAGGATVFVAATALDVDGKQFDLDFVMVNPGENINLDLNDQSIKFWYPVANTSVTVSNYADKTGGGTFAPGGRYACAMIMAYIYNNGYTIDLSTLGPNIIIPPINGAMPTFETNPFQPVVFQFWSDPSSADGAYVVVSTANL